MKTKILIVTHGTFAQGILQAAELITGHQEDVEAMCCYMDSSIDYNNQLIEKISNFNYTKESLIIVTDLLGGSVNNIAMSLIDSYPFLLITGLNLPLLLELIQNKDHLDEETVNQIIEEVKKYTVCCNTALREAIAQDTDC